MLWPCSGVEDTLRTSPHRHPYVTPPTPTFGNHLWGGAQWWRECGGKIAYKFLDHAIAALHELQRLDNSVHTTPHSPNEPPNRVMQVYFCRWCDWFHVGHAPRRPQPNSVYTHTAP